MTLSLLQGAFAMFGVCAVATVLLQLYLGSLRGALERTPDDTAKQARLAVMNRYATWAAIGAGVSLLASMLLGALTRLS